MGDSSFVGCRGSQNRQRWPHVYDGTAHPLGVIALSKSFSGKLSWRNSVATFITITVMTDSIPFHYRQQFSELES